MQSSNQQTAVRYAIISSLLTMVRSDTLYRDLYFVRARSYLQKEMTHDDYLALQRIKTSLASLPNQIRNAMEQGDWFKVRELSEQHKGLQAEVERKNPLQDFAKALYDSQDLPIDPFSPGMSTLAGYSQGRLAELCAETLRQLKYLCKFDGDWKDFYNQRIEVFDDFSFNGESTDASSSPPVSLIETEAAEALEAGNYDKLQRLAEELLQTSGNGASTPSALGKSESDTAVPDDYLFEFALETLKKAQLLGLELHHVPSRYKEFAPLCRFAWHPTFSQLHGNHAGALKVPDLPLPEGTPEDLKSRIQLFAIHPFINSAGVRFLPKMVGEDVLVEDFAEPEAGSEMPKTGLLGALGIEQRNRLSRLQIEALLLEKGNDLLRNELGLDPVDFKLVCIPPDLHLRIGLKRGWGQQKIWTHFDGYMIMADGKILALVGGDVRYGGIYDLLGVTRNYDSDRVIVRFAIVQRKRMATWKDPVL